MAHWIRQVKYNYLIAKIARRLIKIQYRLGYQDEAIANFQHLAAFCSNNYIGTYRWVKLENDLIRISHKHLQAQIEKNNKPGWVKNVVHVITEGYEVGGHTEFLVKWIIADNSRFHTIVFTNQKGPVPDKVNELSKTLGVRIVELSAVSSHLCKAKELRKLSLDCDIVILHNHPFDLVPILAFARNGGAPVGVLNNADHLFWISATIADLVIQLRDFYQPIDKERRQIENSAYLPIPIFIKEKSNYRSVREELGIANEQVLLLTIASEYKFEPIADYNYFENIIQVLNKCLNAVCYIIGVPASSILAKRYKHDRLVFLGVFSDTSKYEVACDIYVESFPFVSYTSLLQTVARGKSCHLVYDPSLLNRCISNENFIYPANKSDWDTELVRLINDQEFRKKTASAQSSFVVSNHSEIGKWKNRLEHCYSKLSSGSHTTNTLRMSKWVYTSNEKILIEIFSKKMNLAGIVSCSNLIFKLLVHGLSDGLVIYKKFRGVK